MFVEPKFRIQKLYRQKYLKLWCTLNLVIIMIMLDILLSAALSAWGSISIYLCELCTILKLLLKLIIFTWSII